MDNEHYISFRASYELMHQASVPNEQDYQPRFQYRSWLRLIVFVMFAAAAVLSGVHTIPTVYKGIQVGVIITEDIRRIASILSFLAVELSVFISAYMMNKNRRLAVAILVVGFIVAMAANISSVFDAFNAVDTGSRIVAVVLGVGAPLMALMAGAMFVEIDNDQRSAYQDAEERFRVARQSFDLSVLDAYMKQTRQKKTLPRVSVSMSDQTENGHLIGQKKTPLLSDNVSDQGKKDKWTRVEEYFLMNPNAMQLGVRTVAAELNVGHDLVSKVRQSINKRQSENDNE